MRSSSHGALSPDALRRLRSNSSDHAGEHSSDHYSHHLARKPLPRLQQLAIDPRTDDATIPGRLDVLLNRYFDHSESNHLSINSRTNFSKYLQDFYTIANPGNAQRLQRQAFYRASVPATSSPLRNQRLPLLLRMPPSSQWPRPHDPSGPLAQTKESEDANTTPISNLSIIFKPTLVPSDPGLRL